MRVVDFLFWHYYCFFERHKKRYFGDNRYQSIIVMCITFAAILGVGSGLVQVFIIGHDIPPQQPVDRKIFGLILVAPVFLYLDYRYYKKKSITKNKFEIFRNRWGDIQNVSPKNMRILLWYTIISTIGMILCAVIVGTLNKNGYFEGCSLFP